MQQELAIVVTCTDRKSVQPSLDLQLRSLGAGGLDARASAWSRRIDAARSRLPLRSLYRGETWAQVAELERAAERAGFRPHLLVASAGLGLVDAETKAPAYGATFSSGHADSVGETVYENQQWWSALNAPKHAIDSALAGPTVLILSKTYADAMAPALAAITGRRDVLVFGGSNAIAASARIPADLGLRRALGGTANSLNLRTARAWFDLLPHPDIALYRQHPKWAAWVSDTRQSDHYDRTPLSDAALESYVQRVRTEDPTISRSRALRLLRDSGLACEQKRFAQLFESSQERA
ncbi:MAG: hypothetical protein QM747_04100 [Nocardioides sp.]